MSEDHGKMIRKTLDEHVVVIPDVCSGQPHIAGHRITVRQIAVWHDRMGLSADEISAEHGLAIAEVYAALAYYFSHRQEIDAEAGAAETLVAELRRSTTSKLNVRPDGVGRDVVGPDE